MDDTLRATAFLALGLALTGCGLAGCEDHPRRVAQAGPEYMHEALTGDVEAQARLAACLDAGGQCMDTPADPAMACAWRGVRLASRSPVLSLADAEAERKACGSLDQSAAQRAAIARDQYVRRLYGRASGPAPTATAGLLYPSIETVRRRLNLELAVARSPRLPPFGAARAAQGQLAWRSCTAQVCLEGTQPDSGGGLVSYRVSVAGPGRPLAARLAAAGLDARALSPALAALDSRSPSLTAGGICWSAADSGGAAVVQARLAPCGPHG